MKTHEIPQDQDAAYEGGKRLCYAVDGQGLIVAAHSSGWEVEEVVKGVAWKVIEDDLAKTRQAVQAGEASALEYYMKVRMMTPRLLSQNIGISTWRVRLHLRRRGFARLSDRWIVRYATCLDVPVERLQACRRNGDV
jgi:hypothetical protein